jgi:hypothetical protein
MTAIVGSRPLQLAPPPSESDIQRATIAQLQLIRGLYWWKPGRTAKWIGTGFPLIYMWRANVVGTKTQHGSFVLAGKPGQGDLSGFVAPNGRRIEIELKSPSGKQSRLQKDFEACCRRCNVAYGIFSDPCDAVYFIRSLVPG